MHKTFTFSLIIEHVLENLRRVFEKLFQWLTFKQQVADAGIQHFLTSSKTPIDIHIFNANTFYEKAAKLLAISQDRPNFDFHMNKLLNEAT